MCRNDTQYFYYNNQWQLLEIRLATYDESGTLTSDKPQRQFVWGTRYIDEAICMDVDTDSDGDCTDLADSPAGARRFFYCQDANYNVIALREGATIVERYEYDAYGVCRVYKGWDSVAAGENLAVIGDSLFGNPIRYAGYFWDNETGTCQVRHRVYHPRLQRWGQRDPWGVSVDTTPFSTPDRPASLLPINPDLQYQDGMNVYQYIGAHPVVATDPLGLGPCPPGYVAVWVYTEGPWPTLKCVPVDLPPPPSYFHHDYKHDSGICGQAQARNGHGTTWKWSSGHCWLACMAARKYGPLVGLLVALAGDWREFRCWGDDVCRDIMAQHTGALAEPAYVELWEDSAAYCDRFCETWAE